MAQKTIIQRIDDIDGSEATTTVHIGYQGQDYLIDLSDDNATRLEDELREIIAVATKIPADEVPRANKRKPASTKGPQIRKWANDNGYDLGPRGRIPSEIVDAYHKANPSA